MQKKEEVSDVKVDKKYINNYSRVKCPDFTPEDDEKYISDRSSLEYTIFE